MLARKDETISLVYAFFRRQKLSCDYNEKDINLVGEISWKCLSSVIEFRPPTPFVALCLQQAFVTF